MSKLICLCAVMAVLTVLAIPVPHPLGIGRLSRVMDIGHFVLFASLTSCFFWDLKPRVWFAFGLAVALAVFSELGQSLVGRQANVGDALIGVLGASSAMAILLAFRKPRSIARNVGALASVVALAAWPVSRAIPYAMDVWSEYWAFPILCDFQTPWQGLRWLTPEAAIRTVPGGYDGISAGEIRFPHDSRGGTVVLKPLIGDWSQYRQLCCEFSFTGDPIKVSASLQAGEGKAKAGARCLDRVFAAGDHCVYIDLHSSPNDGSGQLDLSRVRGLSLRFTGWNGPRTILLRRVFLTSPIDPLNQRLYIGQTSSDQVRPLSFDR